MRRYVLSPKIEIGKERTHRKYTQRHKHEQILSNSAMRRLVVAVVPDRQVLVLCDCVIAHLKNLQQALRSWLLVLPYDKQPAPKTNTATETKRSTPNRRSANIDQCFRQVPPCGGRAS